MCGIGNQQNSTGSTCNSCNMGTSVLPGMCTLVPRAALCTTLIVRGQTFVWIQGAKVVQNMYVFLSLCMYIDAYRYSMLALT